MFVGLAVLPDNQNRKDWFSTVRSTTSSGGRYNCGLSLKNLVVTLIIGLFLNLDLKGSSFGQFAVLIESINLVVKGTLQRDTLPSHESGHCAQ